MTEPDQPRRKSRPIAIIELLDDGGIRLLPVGGSEGEVVEIHAILKGRIKLDE